MLPWYTGEEVFKWPRCGLHIYWPGHLGFHSADSIHDEGMGSRDGNVLYFILNYWKLMSYCSMMGRYLLAIHRPLQPSILWTAGPPFIHALIALNHLCHPTSTAFLVTSLISRKSYPLWCPWLVPLQKHLSLQLKMARCPTAHSPTRNTLSKLSRFLEYAKTTLSVENACLHEESLRMLGFGPNILHLIDNGVLKDVGFTPGDVIRLKQNSQQWWNSVDTKRKWTNELPSAQSTPPNKRVAFEKQFCDGGGCRLYGPRIAKGDFSPSSDVEWFYHCKAQNAMVPLPPGCVPIIEGEDDESAVEAD